MGKEYTKHQIKNAAKSMVFLHGPNVKKHNVRFTIALNNETKGLSENDKEKLVNRIWRIIKKEPVLI